MLRSQTTRQHYSRDLAFDGQATTIVTPADICVEATQAITAMMATATGSVSFARVNVMTCITA